MNGVGVGEADARGGWMRRMCVATGTLSLPLCHPSRSAPDMLSASLVAMSAGVRSFEEMCGPKGLCLNCCKGLDLGN